MKKKQTKPRKTWVGYKPRKEATKKERLEKALKKHKAKERQKERLEYLLRHTDNFCYTYEEED